MQLTIIGLGVNSGDLSLTAYKSIIDSPLVILRTAATNSHAFLNDYHGKVVSLDGVYLKSRNFDTLTKNLVKEVENYLKESDVCYLVDGAVSEDNSAMLLMKKHKGVKVYEGVSKSANALLNCRIPARNYQSVSAYDFCEKLDFTYPLAVYDVDSAQLASAVKIKLGDVCGDETEIYFCHRNSVKKIPVYELDRQENYDYSTVVVVAENKLETKSRFNFTDLYRIVNRLRAKDGCPWDRVQTKESVRKNLIEECYELCDAIDKNDDAKISEEIGDVLLQAAFQVVFLEENGYYTLNDVLSGICSKLIFRHSHVFGNDRATDDQTALEIWDKNKQIEKSFNHKQYVGDVPKCFPSLLRAQKTVKRIKKYSVNHLSESDCKKLLAQFIEESDYANAILVIAYIMNENQLDGEESVYFAIDNILESYMSENDDSFDLKNYFERLRLCR
ncbi:MAG: MazG nucleotide pyrophosphohydrolase domain-containing protein [Christensenellaceae bacterium]